MCEKKTFLCDAVAVERLSSFASFVCVFVNGGMRRTSVVQLSTLIKEKE